jgi:hypothetical protein
MRNEEYNIELITDIDILTDIKENLKQDVLDPNLKWSERMDLYQAIHNINKRIEFLKKGAI